MSNRRRRAQGRRRRRGSRRHASPRARLGDDDREVALGGRVARRRATARIGGRAAAEARDVELRDDEAGAAQVDVLGDERMELADDAAERSRAVRASPRPARRGPGWSSGSSVSGA